MEDFSNVASTLKNYVDNNLKTSDVSIPKVFAKKDLGDGKFAYWIGKKELPSGNTNINCLTDTDLSVLAREDNGIIIITQDGKFQTMMNGDGATFKKYPRS